MPIARPPYSGSRNRQWIRSSAAPEVRAQRAAVETYDRTAALTGLLPLWPEELADESRAGRLRVVMKLRRLLRAERRRGRAGHWTYSVARHAQLAKAYRAELAALQRAAGDRKGARP